MLIQSPSTDIKRIHYLIAKKRVPPSTLLTIFYKMPPSRTPLDCISGNRFKGCGISPYLRGKVAGLVFKGSNPYEIGRVLSLTRSTV